MSNNYDAWFTKWDGWTDGEHTLSVSKIQWKDGKVSFTMRKQGRAETLKFALPFVDAVSADGDKALPSFIKESEVDDAVNSWVWHGRNLFDAR